MPYFLSVFHVKKTTFSEVPFALGGRDGSHLCILIEVFVLTAKVIASSSLKASGHTSQRSFINTVINSRQVNWYKISSWSQRILFFVLCEYLFCCLSFDVKMVLTYWDFFSRMLIWKFNTRVDITDF